MHGDCAGPTSLHRKAWRAVLNLRRLILRSRRGAIGSGVTARTGLQPTDTAGGDCRFLPAFHPAHERYQVPHKAGPPLQVSCAGGRALPEWSMIRPAACRHVRSVCGPSCRSEFFSPRFRRDKSYAGFWVTEVDQVIGPPIGWSSLNVSSASAVAPRGAWPAEPVG